MPGLPIGSASRLCYEESTLPWAGDLIAAVFEALPLGQEGLSAHGVHFDDYAGAVGVGRYGWTSDFVDVGVLPRSRIVLRADQLGPARGGEEGSVAVRDLRVGQFSVVGAGSDPGIVLHNFIEIPVRLTNKRHAIINNVGAKWL